MKRFASLLTVLICLLATLPAVYGQSVTGQISGVVVDPAGATVPGATVQLTHDISQQVRKYTTESNGAFIFTGLVPGSYSLHAAQAGFKGYDQKGVTVAAQERVDLHDIHLAVGDVTSTIEVAANAVHVATDSSDRSISIDLRQIDDTPTRGRNPVNVIMTLPGVQTVASNDYRGWNGGGIPPVNGGGQGQIMLNVDGAASQDSGNLNAGYISPSMDSVGEIKLLTSNYTAEYGGRTAGQLTLTTKNGLPTFHGTAYWYYRHESFNANTFFNNKNKVLRPRYRYQNVGGTIGGPLIIPGTNFNKSRQKLFFFFSYDLLRNNTIGNATFTMPSALERAGDFSKTVTTTGAQVPIYDPLTQNVFPGNIVPASRISPQGQAMLNLFPLPDPQGLALDPTGNRGYNFRYPQQQLRPLDDKILRIDYNFSPKVVTYARLLQDYQAQNGYSVTVGPPGGAWGQFPATDFDQRIKLGHQPRQAGRRSDDRCQQQHEQRRRQDLPG
ncbi:MAG: carboxypeptidase regulatory-like domain-containing protein [Candidatus Solibacter sp.]|nr:carboxypeptidase regulatory-like domain-containing protein [Candidatus Solibacter sp.]